MSDTPITPRGLPTDDLGRALSEIMEHVDAAGWGQSPSVFALVPTALLTERVPGVIADDGSVFTPVEEECPDLDEFLATAWWPDSVEGAAVAMEIVVADPESEDDTVPRYTVADHDDAGTDTEIARLVVGVLRNGTDLALLRPASGETPELLTHPQLATELRAALHGTFAPDAPGS
ncbi:hypothetical protein GDN83_18330 [Gordonia jinghuaiqii]|uniref:Uncharacterized protein n=1 Tax=Gordonia jinghuaiqii TaxID=2758710 RepID=A0A7D7QN93_9ACTN|nr:PPA1309 family protein [Gordonia jinghuaiqii]MCR5979672.1 hypothetical protein [Gordonia jinghuaiqii]QMT00546.1 hypothetical protein H1R19_16810 [Gordonia jinghuaiqii]